jgi:hypothetical protein
MKQKSEYFSEMLLDLQGMEDDLVANGAPVEAVRHIQAAIVLCKEEYQRKYGPSAEHMGS